MIVGRRAYRRDLPHYQQDGRDYSLTFVTASRSELPPEARTIVLQHILVEHLWRAFIHTAVVMPGHVHIILRPLHDESGVTYALRDIAKGIKGSSARSVNKALGRHGRLWQQETFDHELRQCEDLREKCEYVAQNPVRKGLCATPDEYPWLWREWIEGRKGK